MSTINQVREFSNAELLRAIETNTDDAAHAQTVACERQFAGTWIRNAEEAEELRHQIR
jgi:hypothetical protein